MARQRKRNYKREYKQRLQRGKRKGLTVAESRGHKRKTITAPDGHRFRPTGREVEETTKLIRIARDLGVDIHDEVGFMQKLIDIGYTPSEAYTLRFS